MEPQRKGGLEQTPPEDSKQQKYYGSFTFGGLVVGVVVAVVVAKRT